MGHGAWFRPSSPFCVPRPIFSTGHGAWSMEHELNGDISVFEAADKETRGNGDKGKKDEETKSYGHGAWLNF
jgi:hypothetical protein